MNMKKIFIILLIFLVSKVSFATVTITSVTGSSITPDLTVTTPKIFGGVSGQLACASTSTCDSCAVAWDSVDANNKCNSAQIGDSTLITITFTSTSSGTVELRTADGTSVSGFTPVSYTENTTTSVSFSWNIICQAANGVNCDDINSTPSSGFSEVFDFGINTDGNSEIDDIKEINFIVAGIPSGVSSSSDGISDFILYPGDGKAYLEDFGVVDYTFQGANASKILFFFQEASTGASCSGGESTINYQNSYGSVDLISESGSTTKSYQVDFFEGLENGVEYDVRPAIQDEAGNIGLFYNYGTCIQYYNSVLPQPVSGLLSDNSGCFIATAAFGSPYEKHVHTLRLFRDTFLLKHELGKSFVKFYYAYSPAIADIIRESETLRTIFQTALLPLWFVSDLYVRWGQTSILFLFGTVFCLLLIVFSKTLFKKKVKIFFITLLFFSSLAYTQEESAPLEPPYIGVEEEEFKSLENSVESATPEETPLNNSSENYPVDETVGESPQKWSPYQRVPEPSRIKELHDKEGLTRITKKGEFEYNVNPSPQNSAASFRFGTFDAPYLQNANGVTFQSVYGEDTKVVFLGDYEWQFYKKFGKLGVKVGSGLMYAEGSGFFTNTTYFNADGDDSTNEEATEANESYSLFVFPNNLALIYRGQFFDKQWLVPFAEVGIDYFTLIEYRDDGEETNFAGSAHFHFAAGGSFSLNSLSRDIALNIDREYGINNMWLTAEYRRLELITGDFDFSDDLYSAGFMFEF